MPQTIVTFPAADEGRNFKRFSLKMLRCEARAFPVVRLYDKSAIFYSAENAHAYESGHVASGHFVLGRDVLCEFDYCLLAIGSKYASNKGMPAV